MPRTTTSRRLVRAPRASVYAALLSAEDVARWRVPDGMRAEVHAWEARAGGEERVSLTHDAPEAVGKTSARTDTYRGRFAELVPDERVVEVLEFEAADPALQGAMTMTTSLTDADGGTLVEVVHDGVPDGVALADNETGTRMALDRLARLVEGRTPR